MKSKTILAIQIILIITMVVGSLIVAWYAPVI